MEYRYNTQKNYQKKEPTLLAVNQLNLIKQQLVNYVYSCLELSNYKYKILEYEHDLPLLLKQKYFVSSNFLGSSCLLIFTKIHDKYYSYLIDRRTLSYNHYQVNIENVKISSVTLRLDESIYKGSIFDGILIQNPKTKERTFVITDIYTFRGKNMSIDKIQYKIINIVSYMKANYTDDPINNLKITVNKLYELDNIDDLISDIPKMTNFCVKGLTFYPETSGTKLIFMLDNDTRVEQHDNKDNRDNRDNRDNSDNRDIKLINIENVKCLDIKKRLEPNIITIIDKGEKLIFPNYDYEIHITKEVKI